MSAGRLLWVKRKIAKSRQNCFDDRKDSAASLSDFPQFVAALSKVAFEPAAASIPMPSGSQEFATSLTVARCMSRFPAQVVELGSTVHRAPIVPNDQVVDGQGCV
jgi:hypothetical protein